MLEFQWEVRVQHILREGNRVVDCLANLEFRVPLGLHLFNVVPNDAHEITVQYIIGISFYRTCT